MLLNNVVKVLWRVSVRMNVPVMKVTPSTIAIAVSARRSLWARSPLTVTLHMSAAQAPHVLQDRIGGWLQELADHGPVCQKDNAVGVRGTARVVRHHYDRLAQLGHRPAQESEHLGRGVRVEVACRLIC